ncbi:MAG: hypothetical protein M1826_004167 [Phylliscum demangeonii]|nr:MAG: hypothetical protein M1826_004167 [Phylliscum demangeonii]
MLLPRAYTTCRDSYGRLYRCNSGWTSYGRWIFLVALVIFLALILSFLSFSARRRRARGMAPFMGTGWMGGRTPPGHGPAVYNGGAPQGPPQAPYPAPAPAYHAPPNHATQGQQMGYTAGQPAPYGQQSGIELQTPAHAYQPQYGAEPVYMPPPGPPPSHVKEDVRY